MHGESPGPVRTPDFAVHTIVIPPATPTVHPPPAHASHKRKRETSHEIHCVEPDADETAPEWFFKLHGSINGRSLSGLPAIDPTQLGTLVCYVCISDPVPGKFRARDAAALGVPKGPLLGQLAKNLSVTLADGRVITPEQVKDPDTPGKIVVIVPCPSLGDIERATTGCLRILVRWVTFRASSTWACVQLCVILIITLGRPGFPRQQRTFT
jgi:hypothetical protein